MRVCRPTPRHTPRPRPAGWWRLRRQDAARPGWRWRRGRGAAGRWQATATAGRGVGQRHPMEGKGADGCPPCICVFDTADLHQHKAWTPSRSLTSPPVANRLPPPPNAAAVTESAWPASRRVPRGTRIDGGDGAAVVMPWLVCAVAEKNDELWMVKCRKRHEQSTATSPRPPLARPRYGVCAPRTHIHTHTQ